MKDELAWCVLRGGSRLLAVQSLGFRSKEFLSPQIVAKKEQLTQVEERLQQAIALYKLRLEWLASESRRIFGVVQEHCATIILDIKNLSPRQFDHFLCAVERVLKEQVTQMAKFNLIRCAEDISAYAPECVPVSNDSVQFAIDWLWSLDRLAPTGASNTSEAVLRAASDPNVSPCLFSSFRKSKD